nr:hypothetical protein [Pseudanabaena sp. BC1403]
MQNIADLIADYNIFHSQPSLIAMPQTFCNLVEGEYQIIKFRDDERIISQAFPELKLTANQIFQAGVEI